MVEKKKHVFSKNPTFTLLIDYCIEPPFMSYNKIHIIFMSFHLITFECYHDNISYYKIFASKSLRLCRYPPYPRQQHGCPLVRIHLLSNFVVHSVSFSENYRNHQNHDFNFLLGPRIEEIRETRIYPV
jgi:hypothetical protein